MSSNDLRSPAAVLNPPVGAHEATAASPLPAVRLTDKFGRTITDLRVSITDRCNYKCVYCRTGSQGAQFAELAMDDYLRIIRVFVSLGIEKMRLTGGEPLLRKGLVPLLAQLAQLRTNRQRPESRWTLPSPPMGIFWPRWPLPWRAPGLAGSRSAWTPSTRPPSSASRGFPAASTRCWPECAPPSVPGWVRSR